MAVRWPIRRKLQVGLVIVTGVIAVILFGTLQGLGAFTSTVKTADSKLAELDLAEALKREITGLHIPPGMTLGIGEEETRLRKQLKKAREALDRYQIRMQDTIDRGRTVDFGDHEHALVRDLNTGFQAFASAIESARDPKIISVGEESRLSADPGLRAALKRLDELSVLLRFAIFEDLYYRIAVAKQEHRRSMYIVLGTSALGLILMAVMLRFFYGWMYQPIRDLQLGVDRVSQGDFSMPIVVQSSDELHDLAEAFNVMSARLKKAYADLLQQVNERGRQLVQSERLASVGFLAAGVAHEINNPLASIAFCAEGLERRLNDLLGRFPREHEAIAKYLKMIQNEAFRCKSITQGLLEFSRVGEGTRVPSDLSEIVQAVLNMVQHLPRAQGKKIIFRPTLRTIAKANPQEIQQVILNIVVNALDSMDENGTLTIELTQHDDSAEIAFTDTGCGMTQDILDHIFQPFFTRSRAGKGTGLGLSISQKIVSQHGGEIEATSPGPGRGSTFIVRLPMSGLPAKEETVGHAAAA